MGRRWYSGPPEKQPKDCGRPHPQPICMCAECERAARAEGWGFPLNSRKAHYFRGGMSLCRKWGFFGALTPDEGPSSDDCVACAKRRATERAAQEPRP